jgi:hypothetical protein
MPGMRLLGLGPQAVAVLAQAEHHAEHDRGHDPQHRDKPNHRFDPVAPAPKRIPVKSQPASEPGE